MSAVTDQYQFILEEILTKISVKLPSSIFRPDLQSEHLGVFNNPKINLPYCEDRLDLRLMGAIRTPLRASQAILKLLNELQSPTARKFIVSIGVSGTGKTTSIFDVAMKHFVMYLECNVQGGQAVSVGEMTSDRNFMSMVEDINRMYSSNDTQEIFEMKALQRIQVEILSRLLYLRALFKLKADLTPQEYLLGQLTGGQNTISELVKELKYLSFENGQMMLFEVCHDLELNFLGETSVSLCY